jgi:hypothetical protein
MTDAFEAQGEFAPVQSATNNEFTAAVDTVSEAPILEALDAAAPEAAAAEQEPSLPNGFIRLGLAPELIAAVADLGFTQPTTVQDKVIPLAMGGEAGQDGKARFVDLMVSSQTGSRQDRSLPAARAAHAAEAPGRSRSRSQGRIPAPGRRSRRPR